MPDEIKANAVDVEVFTGVEGSQTSEDGQGFALHARRADGHDVMLVFPHTEISNIVENAAMRLAHGRQEDGRNVATAFITLSFSVGQGPQGETVLTLAIGERGNISFLLPTDMSGQLREMLGKLQVRH
jgi:hypothetical protein